MTKKSKTKMAKKVGKLEKAVQDLYIPDHEMTIYTGGQFVRKFVGIDATTSGIDQLGLTQVLTTLGLGTGQQSRDEAKVNFKNLRGRITLRAPSTGLGDDQVARVRVQIIKVKQMKGDVGTHTLPNVNDIFTTTTTMTEGDINAFITPNKADKGSGNYRILFDKRVDICLFGGGSILKPKKYFVDASKGGYRECDLEYLGSGISCQIEYHIKCDSSMTTYDADTNSTGACNENHYILVFWNELYSAETNPAPVVDYCLKSTYIDG